MRRPNLDDLGPDAWNEEGIKILGTPVGSHQFVSEVSNARVEEENRLWEAVSWVSDIQCWQILLQCAGPRCHHYSRAIPPSQSETYADGHDGGMWRAFEALMGRLPGDIQEREAARRGQFAHEAGRTWVSAQHEEWLQLRIGHRGRIASPCSPRDSRNLV